MSILSSEIQQILNCCMSKEKHFLNEPIVLDCGHSACRQCIVNKRGCEFKCEFSGCDKTHKMKSLSHLTPNLTVPVLISSYRKEIIETLKGDYENQLILLQDLINGHQIDENCKNLKNEIKSKIESLKTDLDNIGSTMCERVESLKEDMKRYKLMDFYKLIFKSSLQSYFHFFTLF